MLDADGQIMLEAWTGLPLELGLKMEVGPAATGPEGAGRFLG